MNERRETFSAGLLGTIVFLALAVGGCGTSTTAPIVPTDCEDNPTLEECQDPDPGANLELPGGAAPVGTL